MRIPAILLALLLLSPIGAFAQAPAALLEDGPYVLWTGPAAKVLRVRQGKAEVSALPANHRLQLEGLPPLTLDPAPPQPAPCIFPQPARIAAVSDLHGNHAALVTLLVKHGIMDAAGTWTYGKDHLVVVGDTFDRGIGVTACFWLLRSLQAQALHAGGRVHVLLGNHEVMVLGGDLRYMNPKYQALPALLSLDIPALYGPDSDQGRWLRSLNVMVRLGDILFVHGGVSPALAKETGDLAAVNAQFRKALGTPRDRDRNPLMGRDGPVWYRGLLPGRGPRDATDDEVTAILGTYHASKIVVGHSTLSHVTSYHGGRVFGIDADLQQGRDGELWLWEKGKALRGLMDGSKTPL
jgi:hypothetical protein